MDHVTFFFNQLLLIIYLFIRQFLSSFSGCNIQISDLSASSVLCGPEIT